MGLNGSRKIEIKNHRGVWDLPDWQIPASSIPPIINTYFFGSRWCVTKLDKSA